MGSTWVRATIDLNAPGKSVGHLLVPISTDESAYGVVPIPIVVINGAPGPAVLLIGAVHGDEYEGSIVLDDLARRQSRRRSPGEWLWCHISTFRH